MTKTIEIKDFQYKKRIPKIADVFGEEFYNDCDEHGFYFNNEFGKGFIRGTNFGFGVSVMMMDVTLKEELVFEYHLGRRHPINFIYVQNGHFVVRLEDQSENTISQNECSIFAPDGDSVYSFVLPANTHTQIIYSSIVRFLFLRKIECDLDTMPDTLQDMFRDTTGENRFYFSSTSEPITINILRDLFLTNQVGLERKLLLESKSLELITQLVKRFRSERSASMAGYRFSKYDIEKVNLAKNIIIDSIQDIPTVKELAFAVGINTNKLQKGFKLVFQKSIRKFIISYKMHLALQMLAEDQYSISDVAHYLGYVNKGHFSHLFKTEFGLLPSEYRANVLSK